MRHNGIKNHVCPICGLAKVTGHELRTHMRCHSEVQYACDGVFDNAAAIDKEVDFDSDSDHSKEKVQTNSNGSVSMDMPIQEVEPVKEKLDDDAFNHSGSDDDSGDSDEKVEKEVIFHSSNVICSYHLLEQVQNTEISRLFQSASDSTKIK